MEIIVTLYLFLFLFIFLYEISPPILNIFLIILGTFNFLAFIFISALFLIECIGETFAAFLAILNDDK